MPYSDRTDQQCVDLLPHLVHIHPLASLSEASPLCSDGSRNGSLICSPEPITVAGESEGTHWSGRGYMGTWKQLPILGSAIHPTRTMWDERWSSAEHQTSWPEWEIRVYAEEQGILLSQFLLLFSFPPFSSWNCSFVIAFDTPKQRQRHWIPVQTFFQH